MIAWKMYLSVKYGDFGVSISRLVGYLIPFIDPLSNVHNSFPAKTGCAASTLSEKIPGGY